jgi:hypothetical protein
MSTVSVSNLKNAASATNNLVLNPDGSVNISGGTLSPQTGFKNRIINGAMTIDQRNAGASVTPAGTSYALDRWVAGMSLASKFSVQQNAGSVTPPVGFTNYLGCTSLSAYSVGSSDNFVIVQRIEGYNVADLGWGSASAQTVTVSFWVRSSLTGTFGGSLRNADNTRSYPFSYTISSANTWEQKSITIAGDTTGTWLTTTGIGIAAAFSLGTGTTSSGTAGAWTAGSFTSATGATSVVGTNGATFYITGVQLEKGSVATPFEFRSIGQELGLAQRYCYVTNGSVSVTGPVVVTNATTSQRFVFPVPLRASPTATINTAGSYVVSDDRISDYEATTFSISSSITNTLAARVNITGFTILPTLGSFVCGIPNGGTGRISFSAEL